MFDKEMLAKVKENQSKFEEKTEASLAKRPEREEKFLTGSGEEIQRLYSPVDVEGMDYVLIP